MRRLLPLTLLTAIALAGCGSQTKTVTVASAPTPTSSSTATTAPDTTSSSPATTSTATTPTDTSTTRTAPEPSFTEPEQEAKSGTLGAAVAALHTRGYTPNDTSEYHSGQTLRVLVGTRTGSADGYGQQAFFFVDGHYLGTDTKEASAKVKVVSQNDTEVAIAYPLYRAGDPLCCPGGGQRVVHFALNNGKLAALDPIPPANSKSGDSRN
ncbi:MAG TPA: LppP/LprE family lipoprotein [Solirubrobacteraceae bacterium]|nr:LppP/LprE family lipoprotein [Solirubrobacteraceae bacterium]